MKNRGKLFVISAPSGAGKTTLVSQVLALLRISHDIKRVVTYTTKESHASEQAEIDYHFICEKEFEQKIKENFFIEWSKAYGYYYGSPTHVLYDLELGKSLIFVLDQQGACAIYQKYPESVLIWISPPDISVLEERLLRRARDKQHDIVRRLQLAREEMMREEAEIFFKYHLINADFFLSAKRLLTIFKKELQL